MALDSALDKLVMEVGVLSSCLGELDDNAGDIAEEEGSSLAVQVSEAITELNGLGQEALDSAHEAKYVVLLAFDSSRLRRLVADSQERFHKLEAAFFADLVSYERIRQLVAFADERQNWSGWVESVCQGLENCRPAVQGVRDAYFEFWQEMAERAAGNPVAVHTTNIGQQITAETLRSREGQKEPARDTAT